MRLRDHVGRDASSARRTRPPSAGSPSRRTRARARAARAARRVSANETPPATPVSICGHGRRSRVRLTSQSIASLRRAVEQPVKRTSAPSVGCRAHGDRRPSVPPLDPLDYLAIDALLDDEERAIRDTVRAVRARQRPRRGRRLVREGDLPARDLPGAREARPLRDAPRRLRPARARAPSPTASPAWSSRRATRACAAPSPSRARSRCSRSGVRAPRSRRSAGCPPMHTRRGRSAASA